MRKNKWNVILNFSLLVVALMVGASFGVVNILKNFNSVYAENVKDPVQVNVPFQVGQALRTANGFSDGHFTYTVENQVGEHVSTSLETKLTNGQTYMLRNYDAQNSLILGSPLQEIKNIYIGFGAPKENIFGGESVDLETYGNNGLLTSITDVTGKLNGEYIKINPVTVESADANIVDRGYTGPYDHWFQYLDLTSITTNPVSGTPQTITNPEGFYEFSFTYFFISYDGSSFKLDGPYTHTFSFYLLNESSYATNYPTITGAQAGNGDVNRTEQFFYNYQSATLPTIAFDPTRYNLSYTKLKDDTTETVTTSFAINSNGEGVLTINSSLTGTTQKTITNLGGGQYLASLSWDELGTYNFLLRYVVKTGEGFRVVSETEIPSYDITRYDNQLGGNPYLLEKFTKGRYKLHNFGVRSYFIKNGEKTLFANGATVSDYTAKINGKGITIEAITQDGNSNYIPPNYYASVGDGAFPVTNLPPISFDSFASYTFTGTDNLQPESMIFRYNGVPTADSTPISTAFFTKNTQISAEGFYEVVLSYTFDQYSVGLSGSGAIFYQVFVFRIEAQTPVLTIKTTNTTTANLSTDALLHTSGYTNGNVYAHFTTPNFFQHPITISQTRTNFNGTGSQTSALTLTSSGNQSLTPLITTNGNYSLRVYYSTSQSHYVDYVFVRDKSDISNIKISPIDKESLLSGTNNDYYLVTEADRVNFTSALINQPFTLTYNRKESGALITTTYQKIPFTAYAGGAQSVDSTTYANYIKTSNQINYGEITSPLEYVFNYNVFQTGYVSANNVFNEDNSFIYLFTIKDQAGNTNTTGVVYDLTVPQVIINPAVSNDYNIVNTETNILWGSHKAVYINNGAEITNASFKAFVENQPELFKKLGGNYYLVSPVTSVSFTNNATGQSHSFVAGQTSFATNTTLYPTAPVGASERQNFFSGEKSYVYTIKTSSNLQSTTNVAKTTHYQNGIWLNLDNTLALLYGKHAGATYDGTQPLEIGEALDWNKSTSSAHQLRLTYRPGEAGTEYEVESFTYTYYEFDPSAYTSIAGARAQSSYSPAEGEPVATYPFSTKPNITNRDIIISTISIPGQTEGANLRVVSSVINGTGDSNNYTKPGFYVFKRTYANTLSGDSLDTQVRYYTFVVERDKIINIDVSDDPEDVDLTSLTNPTADSILYRMGSGIYFKYTNNPSDQSRYSALDIQQHIAYTSEYYKLFDSNKLPVKLTLPNDKFNSAFTLRKASDSANENSYITSVASRNWFNLDFKISFTPTGSTASIDILNTKNPIFSAGYYDSNYINPYTDTENGLKELTFRLAGNYLVTIFSNKSAEVAAVGVHPQIDYVFGFTISHESPTGNYYSTYENNSPRLLEVKRSDTNLVNFYSTNSDVLKFVFEENSNPYKAQIDADNLTVKRTSLAGTTQTIFTRIGGINDSQNVFSQTTNDQGYKVYTLDLSNFATDASHYLGATYTATINFIGNEADFTIPVGTQTVNYFKRDFTIVVDREAPQLNYNRIVAADAQKFNAANVSGLNVQNYFYALNGNFKFIKDSLKGDLDSQMFYVRPLELVNGFPNYKFTITPDSALSGTDDPKYADNPRFSETDYPSTQVFTYYNDGGQFTITGSQMFDALVSEHQTNYFEVLERDEAGNFRVWAVQYVSDMFTPQITLTHKKINNENLDTNTVDVNKKNITVDGYNLELTDLISHDYFLKATVFNTQNTVTIVNNPYTNASPTDTTDFLQKIQNALAFTTTPTTTGHNVTITFVNRYDTNYTITYLVPGMRQEPIFKQLSSTQFTITLPDDTLSSRITQFKVWKFENGAWNTTDLARDDKGTPIRKGEAGGPSLQKQTYTFGVGAYRFQLIDNFGRGENLIDFPAFYYDIGINNVNEINYGVHKIENGIVYTANSVTLRYQINLYEISVYKYVVNSSGEKTKVLITDLSLEPNLSVIINNTTNVRTLTFSLPGTNVLQEYEIQLSSQRHTPAPYKFIIYKKLPTITLLTLSGNVLDPKTSPFTENFLIKWSEDTLDFNSTVTLYRTYTGADGKLATQVISNISNGYQVSQIGSYRATITNALGFTSSVYDLSFQLVSGSVVVYEVIAISSGYETIINASPISDTINIDGVPKVLHKYYTLAQYNGTVPNNEIQIRANTNKALSVELLPPGENQNNDSRIYKIYGTGDYGYEAYVEIIFVNKPSTNENFTNLQAFAATYNENGEQTSDTPIAITADLRSSSEYLRLVWNSYNPSISSNNVVNYGNIVYVNYYFNNVFVNTIYRTDKLTNNFKISAAGIHKFQFYDLAGNRQTFNGYSELTINLINNLTFLVNGDEPINNIIVNNALKLEVTNRALYDSDPVVTAKRNGQTLEISRESTQGYVYNFTTQGYYEITMSANVRILGVNHVVTTTYNFIILNSEQKLFAYNLPQNYNFTVESLVYNGSDITYTLPNQHELWLSQGATGNGLYAITLKAYLPALQTYRTFNFTLFISDTVPEITSSIDFGTSTTKDIEFFYNAYKIYDALGESVLRIRLVNGNTVDLQINNESQNVITSHKLTNKGVYFIEILTKDGKLITSYKLEKTEPLNTTSIVVISIVASIVLALAVTFIVLRSRVRFR